MSGEVSDAVTKALRYDGAGRGEVTDIRFFTELGLKCQLSYDKYGKTAMVS